MSRTDAHVRPGDGVSSSDTGALPLRPLRVLALGGLAAVVLVATVFGLLYRAQLVDAHVQEAERKAAALTTTLTQALRDDLPLLAVPAEGQAVPLPSSEETERFKSRIQEVAAVLPLLEVSILDRRGTVVLSTDREAIGTTRRPPSGLAEALRGRPQSAFTARTQYALFDEVHITSYALATLVPVYDESARTVVGVAAVHLDLAESMEGLTAEVAETTAGTAGALAVVYVALLVFGRYVERLLRAQQAQIAAEMAERREADAHLRRVQDAMETTIAERTRRLRESEARFREFAESSSDWLWETDQNHRFTYISEGFRRLVNQEPSFILGHSRIDLRADPHETPARWQAHLDDLRHHRPFRGFCYTMRLPDGRTRYLSVSGTPIFDENGRFHGYRGTGTDLTHQHEAEQTITRMGRIIDQSANEVYIFDGETLHFLQVNRGARLNLGHSVEELVGLTPLDIMPLETRDSFERRLAPLRQRPSTSTVFESLYQRKDGSRYPVEVRLQYMAQERPPVFVAVVQDITARRQAELALQESEERFRSVAEMSLDGIVVHVDGVIVYANRQAVQIARANTVGDLIDQPIERFIHPDHRAAIFERVRHMHETGRPTERAEFRLLRLSGQPFDAEMSSSPITYGGRAATQTVLRDVTDSKVVQGQLIQTAKLATLGEMAAGMAHELSQPMNVIRMAAEGALLERNGGSTAGDANRAALEIISAQAARMGDIIEHMRIFSRKEAEAIEVFDPALCVKQAVDMIEAQLYAEGISLNARYPSGSYGVRGRPVHLEQVLLNLLTNARDSIRQRWRNEEETGEGEIAIETFVTSGEDRLIIRVTDNGGGIPPEIMDRIFEPFYTTKEVGTGTGLGLSVSYSLIAAMDGTLRARNVDRGAQFEIALPIARDAFSAEAPPSGLHAVAVPPEDADDGEPSALLTHVLVVDDEPFATKLVADHLERLGYRVTTASDGEEGYEKFLEDPPDLVITDLRMPHCDGAEMVRRMQNHVPDLPVIVATGHLGHLEAAAGTLQDQTVAILKKPISLSELTRHVRVAVRLPDAAKEVSE